MENESFERALEPQPIKRKRSSILKPGEKRTCKDSRTVSFNDRCIYKELHQDGTCDITNLFLRQDMDLTDLDVVEPIIDYHNQTMNSDMDISMSRTMNNRSDYNDNKQQNSHDNTLIEQKVESMLAASIMPMAASPTQPLPLNHDQEDQCTDHGDELSMTMIEESQTQATPLSFTPQKLAETIQEQQQEQQRLEQQHNHFQRQQYHDRSSSTQKIDCPDRHNDSSQMDISMISQFMSTMPKVNNIDLPSVNYDVSTVYEKRMSMATDMSGISSLNSTLIAKSADSSRVESDESSIKLEDTTLVAPKDGTTLMDNCTLGRIMDISSFNNNISVAEQSANETFFGAFHDSNNISYQSRTSGVDTLVHKIEILNDVVHKADHEFEESRRRLDAEIEELFKFYRHIVNKSDKYEFALRIFGLRHSLWLIFKINPDTYPNEKLKIKFVVNRRDRHLYPFPEFAEAVRRCTDEGRTGYLTRLVINAQKFRRFLRSIGYRKQTNKQ